MPADSGQINSEGAAWVHPLGVNVLIKPVETPNEVGVGKLNLIIPDAAKQQYPTEGVVMELGPDCPMVTVEDPETRQETDRPLLQAGDRVVYTKYTGLELKFGNGERFLLVPFHDIQGILDPQCPGLDKPDEPRFTPAGR